MKITNNKNWIANNYFIKKYEDLNSFKREKYFYYYFKNSNLPIPKVISFKRNLIIFKNFKIKNIKNKRLFILETFKFLTQINSRKKIYKYDAKESFLNINKLKKEIRKRLLNLKKINNKDLKKFLNKISQKFKQLSLSKIKNPRRKKIISPSDIGYHNAGIFNKKILFFDFEYSGLDHPLKTICDFYYQPEMRVSRKEMINHTKKFGIFLKYDLISELKKVEELYKIKMCLIILNVFLKKRFKLKKKILNSQAMIKKIKKERLNKSMKIFSLKKISQ